MDVMRIKIIVSLFKKKMYPVLVYHIVSTDSMLQRFNLHIGSTNDVPFILLVMSAVIVSQLSGLIIILY